MPAIPNPGMTNNSNITNRMPTRISNRSAALARPARYGAATKMVRQVTATSPGIPNPGV